MYEKCVCLWFKRTLTSSTKLRLSSGPFGNSQSRSSPSKLRSLKNSIALKINTRRLYLSADIVLNRSVPNDHPPGNAKYKEKKKNQQKRSTKRKEREKRETKEEETELAWPKQLPIKGYHSSSAADIFCLGIYTFCWINLNCDLNLSFILFKKKINSNWGNVECFF